MGNNSDLYPRWVGSRYALLYRQNPYSDEVTREIQTGFYGRPLDARKPGDPVSQESFVYPLYVVFLMAPTVTVPFATVQAVFRWLLLLSLAGSVPLWMQAAGARTQLLYLVAGMILAVSNYPAILEFHMQNLAALVFLFLASAGALVAHGRQVLAGFCLALATIKPEVSWLVVLWFLFWAISDYSARKRLVWSFLASMLTLILAAEAMVPHWIGWFIIAVRQYPNYGTEPNIFQIFLPIWLANAVAVGLIALLLRFWWQWRKASPGQTEFGWALALTAAVTLAILPKLSAYNQPLLIPALILLLTTQEANLGLLGRAFRKSAFACQIWQWLAALMLSICSLAVPATRLLKASQWPLLTFLALPPTTLLAVIFVTFAIQRASRSTTA